MIRRPVIRLRRRYLIVPGLVVLVAFVTVAAASTLGGITSNTVTAFSASGVSGAKIVYASDSFTGTTGTNLNARALLVGSTWSAIAGTWTINSSGQAENVAVSFGRLVTPTSHADIRAIVTDFDSGAGSRASGIVFRSDATAATFLYVYGVNAGGQQFRLAKYAAGASTDLASVTVSFTNPATLQVEANGAVVKVYYSGTLLITYTLTTAEQTTYGALGSCGLLNNNTGSKIVQFDDFRVESL
jgi:hypothetical protein